MSLIPLDITQAFSTDLEPGVWEYASISNSVLSPAGFPTVRLGADHTWRQTRELNLNYNPNWVKGLVKPGDRIIWRIKARTDLEGGLDVVNTDYTGARLGIDYLCMVPDYQSNVNGRPHNYENRNGVMVSGDYIAPDGNVLPDNTPVSKFQLPFGRGWSTLEWDVVLPNNIFTKDSNANDLGGSFQIDGLAAWIDAREIDIEAPVYFGDPEFYINPMSVNKVLTISSVGSGHTSPSGTQQYPDGTSVLVSAIADTGNYLVGWTLDGLDVGTTENPIPVLMNANHILVANFAPIVNPYVLVINGSLYGVTNPAAGMYQFTQNQIVPVSATPIGGYVFDHWLKDGLDVGNITEIVMDMSHTLTPVFVQSGGGFMLPLLVGAGLAVGTWFITR